MFKNIFSLFLLHIHVIACSNQIQFPKNILSNKIIGGEPITAKDIPFQVSIQHNGTHMCGGMLITLQHVLTAAQCVHNKIENGKYELIPPLELVIKAGNEWLNNTVENVQYRRGMNISAHLDYNPNSSFDFDHDIAVIKVLSYFDITPTVSTASLRYAPSEAGEMCMVIGWGITQEGGSLSEQLNKVNVPIFDYDQCKNIFGNMLSDQMICAGYIEGGKDSCWGDIGGPLICDRGVVAGIVTFKENCGQPSSPGVYTEINPHMYWINQALATT